MAGGVWWKRRQAKELGLYFMGSGEPLKGFPQKGNVVRFMFQGLHFDDHKSGLADVAGLPIYSNLLETLPPLQPF